MARARERDPLEPASELELPRAEQRLPKHILNEREMEKVLAFMGVKGRAGFVVNVGQRGGGDGEYAERGKDRVAQGPDGRFPHG